MKRNIIILLLFSVGLTLAQEGKIKRANDDFENYAFMDAIASYEDLVKEGYSDEEIFKKLGNANYVNAQYKKASEWYGKLIQLQNVTIKPDYLYRYAQSLKSLGKYAESDLWMQKLKNEKPDDQRAIKYAAQENYLDAIKRNSGRYILKNLVINSASSDFAPSFYRKQLVFSTARDTGITSRNIHAWNKDSFLNLYCTDVLEDGELVQIKAFSKKLNTKTHESSSVFTKDGKTIYFTRNNSRNGRFTRDSEGVSRLKVFRAKYVEGEWKNITKLPFNSDDYSVAHPALSEDEKTLYFSSDMPGTFGASDIFKVSINKDNGFGTPENLGHEVNTEARETFPFVNDNILYFSSDGHPGLGGLDVFATKLDNTSRQVINLGAPLNGTQDDFSYIVNDGKGYFSSNREGGIGSDDIYSFVENSPLNFRCISALTGVVKNQETGKPLNTSRVILLSDENIVAEVETNDQGVFKLEIDCNKENYSIVANKEGYQSTNIDFEVERGKPIKLELLLPNEKPLVAQIGTNLLKHLKLQSIYFDLDKSDIRKDAQLIMEKVTNYLKEFPETKISIESHTDAKASTTYNQRLSARRAKATRDYLIGLGISSSRLSYKGFGEENLVNDCKRWENCSVIENQKNRRSEIIVVE